MYIFVHLYVCSQGTYWARFSNEKATYLSIRPILGNFLFDSQPKLDAKRYQISRLQASNVRFNPSSIWLLDTSNLSSNGNRFTTVRPVLQLSPITVGSNRAGL